MKRSVHIMEYCCETIENTTISPAIKKMRSIQKPSIKGSFFDYISTDQWSGFGYCIPKSSLNHDEIELHRKKLRLEPRLNLLFNPAKRKLEEKDIYYMYHEDQKHFVVPRMYGIQTWGSPEKNNFTIGEQMQNTIEFIGKPKGSKIDEPPQIKSINRILRYFGHKNLIPMNDTQNLFQEEFEENGSTCIMSLPCGFGKTFCALYIAHQLKRKTIVFVHREHLLDGWKADINRFMPGTRIGIIKGPKVDVKDKDIVIAMIQSVVRKPYDENVFKGFGFAIVDEAHHICAHSFCTIFDKIGAKNVLGLSATPQRSDGLNNLLNWLLGPIIVKEAELPSRILCSIVKYKHDEQKEIFYKGNLQMSQMINTILADNYRNMLMAKIIVDLVLKPAPLLIPRKVLFLSERSRDKHLDTMQKLIAIQAKNVYCYLNKNTTKEQISEEWEGKYKFVLYKQETEKTPIFSIGFLVGGMKNQEDRETAKSCNVILSLFHCTEDGFNCPELDTLVVAISSRGSIKQAKGRIEREHPNKNIPKIVEIVDQFSKFQSIGNGHVRYYEKCGCQIQFIPHEKKILSNNK